MTTTTARSHGRLVINERTSPSDGMELRARARPIDNGVEQGEQRTTDDEIGHLRSINSRQPRPACSHGPTWRMGSNTFSKPLPRRSQRRRHSQPTFAVMSMRLGNAGSVAKDETEPQENHIIQSEVAQEVWIDGDGYH